MITLKATGRLLTKIVDDYIPAIAFFVMFVAFTIQIFTRYVLNDPASWPWDITIIGFVWTILLSAVRSIRTHDHVQFSLIYSARTDVGKAVFRVIGGILLVGTLAIAIPPSWSYVYFSRIMKRGVLRIPLIYVFFPFMIFIVLSAVFLFVDLVKDIRSLIALVRTRKGGAA